MKTPLKIVVIVLAIVVVLALAFGVAVIVEAKKVAPEATVWELIKVAVDPDTWADSPESTPAEDATDASGSEDSAASSAESVAALAGTWVDESGAEWTCEYQADTESVDIYPTNAQEFLEDQYTIWAKPDGSLGMFLSADLRIDEEQAWVDATISADKITSDAFGTLTKQ